MLPLRRGIWTLCTICLRTYVSTTVPRLIFIQPCQILGENLFTTIREKSSMTQSILFLILDVPTNNMHHTADHPTAHTYSNSNTPPLTTHLALNVFGTLRGQCPCDGYRDDKRNDRFCYVRTCCSSEFSQRPLHRATNVRSQRPWTNALGGLY